MFLRSQHEAPIFCCAGRTRKACSLSHTDTQQGTVLCAPPFSLPFGAFSTRSTPLASQPSIAVRGLKEGPKGHSSIFSPERSSSWCDPHSWLLHICKVRHGHSRGWPMPLRCACESFSSLIGKGRRRGRGSGGGLSACNVFSSFLGSGSGGSGDIFFCVKCPPPQRILS